MDGMLLRISMPGEGPHGGPNPVPHYGDQLSERSALGVAAEGIAKVDYVEHAGSFGDGTAYRLRAPRYGIVHQAYGSMPGDMLVSARVAPQMIGLGLLEAVELQTLQALADPHDADGDGISGRANLVWNADRGLKEVGRFGWKAGQPDLINQNAAAALGDIGLTTSLHPTENCAVAQVQCLAALSGGTPEINDGVLQKLTLYTATLAVPAQRNAGDPSVVAGQLLFRDFGCAACHVPTLRSGAHDLPELARQTFHPFTDLLLHDMGDGLADNRPEFLATGREWRTPPLWGLGLIPRVNGHDFLLHDGRARGSAEAILWHGGEAKDAKERFRLAPKAERDQLIAFLNSL